MSGRPFTHSLCLTLVALALVATSSSARAEGFRPYWELGGFIGGHWFN